MKKKVNKERLEAAKKEKAEQIKTQQIVKK